MNSTFIVLKKTMKVFFYSSLSLFYIFSILLINVKSLFVHLTSFLFDVLIIKAQK